MNNIKTAFSYFLPYDFTGNLSTSGYALPFCYFTFVPLLDKLEGSKDVVLSNKRIVWDFGDGTTVESITGRHAFKEPGRYKVTSYLYDSKGDSYINEYSQVITITNFVEDALTIEPINGENYVLSAGRFDFPIKVTRATSWQYYESDQPSKLDPVTFFRPPSSFAPPAKKTYKPKEEARDITQIEYKAPTIDIKKPLSINVSISGSGRDYFNNGYHTLQYGHLYPYSAVYLFLTGTNGTTEYVEVSSFETSSDPVYIKISNNSIVRTVSSDVDAFFCGTTGTQVIYYKDDIPTYKENIVLWYEPGIIRPGVNILPVGFSVPVYRNFDYNKLSFSSNGIDGEGTSTNLFPIDKNKFSNAQIGFVIRVKDSLNYSIKDISLLTNINLKLTDGIKDYHFITNPDFGSLSSLTTGGFYKGYITPYTDTLAENVFLSASCRVGGKSLSGVSNTFNVYPSAGIYDIAKYGEDIDFQQTFKDIAFQPLFLDNKVLFSDFLGSIFGSLESAQDSLGKVTYEKIKNFVDNNAVLDYCNIDQLLSILRSYNLNDIKFQRDNFQYPPALGRLINILSINRSRLYGSENKFDRSFKTYGYLNSDIYGKNLGPSITLNYTVTAGTDIVAFEKFSGGYKLLNTYLPLCASSITVTDNKYQLINYNDTWGWNLVLPSDGYGENISNYYLFYEYIPGINGNIENGIVNFTDNNTTLDFNLSSYEEWSKKDGIIANILIEQFNIGLDLYNQNRAASSPPPKSFFLLEDGKDKLTQDQDFVSQE